VIVMADLAVRDADPRDRDGPIRVIVMDRSR
jgi:hypothetical protein